MNSSSIFHVWCLNEKLTTALYFSPIWGLLRRAKAELGTIKPQCYSHVMDRSLLFTRVVAVIATLTRLSRGQQ
jgi:hypothetical protein